MNMEQFAKLSFKDKLKFYFRFCLFLTAMVVVSKVFDMYVYDLEGKLGFILYMLAALYGQLILDENEELELKNEELKESV